MIWTDQLPILPDYPAMFAPEPTLVTVRAGFHVRRAGFGVFAAVYLREATRDPRWSVYRAWKSDPVGQAQALDSMAGVIVALVKAWSPVLPPDWTVTTPPAGASGGGMYPAGMLASEVANRLDLDFQTTLRRNDAKRHHHPVESRRQKPYTVAVVPPAVVLIVDDFISSGTTMRLAREALAAAGLPAFGFAWGCD